VLFVAARLAGPHLQELLGPSEPHSPRVVLHTVFSWKIWAGMALILGLEYVAPADDTQPLFSRGLGHDLLYAVVRFALWWWLLSLYLHALRHAFSAHLGFFHPHRLDSLPSWVVVPIGYVLADFLVYGHHWIRHKVGVLWRFHAVHHAQRQLNAFTDDRVHPFEWFFGATILFLPLFVLSGAKATDVLLISYILGWQTRLLHANVRTDFGPLRYLLVSPQSHRVHHSIEPKHMDKNFGGFLSVWDRIFGTYCDAAGDYPSTGVTDTVINEAERLPAFSSYVGLLSAPMRIERWSAGVADR